MVLEFFEANLGGCWGEGEGLVFEVAVENTWMRENVLGVGGLGTREYCMGILEVEARRCAC